MFSSFFFIFVADSKTLYTTVEHIQNTQRIKTALTLHSMLLVICQMQSYIHITLMLDLVYSLFLKCVRKGFPECIYFYEHLEIRFLKCILNMNIRGINHLFFSLTLVYLYIGQAFERFLQFLLCCPLASFCSELRKQQTVVLFLGKWDSMTHLCFRDLKTCSSALSTFFKEKSKRQCFINDILLLCLGRLVF